MGFLADLKKLVYNQTQKVGAPVGNIYGAAQVALAKLSSAEQSAWLALTVPSGSVISVDNFYALYSSLGTAAASVITSTTGAVVFQYAGSDTVTTLVRGSLALVQGRTFTLAVDTGNNKADFIVQVDGVVARRDTGSAEIGIHLDPGTHVIEILAVSNVVGIQIPNDLAVGANFEQVPTPLWASITTGYVDAPQGPATVGLSWQVDPTAGGWRVLRRQLTPLSVVIAANPADSSAIYSVLLTGDETSAIAVGQELFAAHELMGVVLSTRIDSGNTLVSLRLPPGRLTPSPYWPAQTAMSGTFLEIQRVGRTQAAGQMVWNDNNVQAGQLYDYALQAWGFLDSNTWSSLSETRSVRAGDTTPPAAIVFLATFPTVVDRRAYAQFHTPADSDYSGVHVYYRRKFTGTATSGTASSIVNSGATFSGIDATWQVRITAGTGIGQQRAVTSATTTSVFVAPNWETTPDNTSVYLIFMDTPIVTDFGVPSTIDALDFEPFSTDPAGPVQEYQFRAFDTAFNEQLDVDSTSWTFDPGAALAWTSPPIVGIRQVPPAHSGALTGQADFASPLNNTTNYAIVELTASDVEGRRSGITIFYQRRSEGSPQALLATAAPTTELGTPAQVDNPSGTRSRYIEIARTTISNWVRVYAVDADGNKSDAVTYTVDYNNAPQISSLEGRVDPAPVFSAVWNSGSNPFGTGLVGTTGVVWITGAVDNNTQAMKYWVEDPTGTDPTVGSPRTLDTTIDRAFSFVISLGDGERKNLIVEPWSGISGGVATGVAGVQVAQEFSRSPRAQSNFEDKDEGGNFSGKVVTALFDVRPAPSVQTAAGAATTRTVHSIASTGATLKDGGHSADGTSIGSPAWATSPPVWGLQAPKKFFVIAKNASSRGGTWASFGMGLGADVRLNDGDTSTNAWNTNSAIPGAFVGTNMGTETLFNECRIFAAAADYKGSYKIRGSHDGTTWLDLISGFVPSVAGWNVFALPARRVEDPTSKAFYKYWRAELTNTPGSGPWLNEIEFRLTDDQVADIISNTADTLTIDPSWDAVPHAALYWIVDSAVMQRLDESGNFVPSGGMTLNATTGFYEPSSGIVVFDRQPGTTPTIVEYFGAKNKCPDQGVIRLTVDADTIPSFADLTLTEISANDLRATLSGPDDDVKVWRSYRRKGAWPTLSGLAPTSAADMDRQYLHHTETVQSLSYDSFAGTGQQYLVVIPTNSMNQDGFPLAKTIAISGNLGSPQLSNLRVVHADSGGIAYNRVIWDHPNIIDADATFALKVFGYRKISGSGAVDVVETELTTGVTRRVPLDSETGSGILNTDDTSSSTISGRGSWVHNPGTDFNIRANSSTGVSYTWVYTVKLYTDGTFGTLVGTYTIEDQDYYIPPACHVLTCTATITEPGVQTGGFCQTHPTRVVDWTTDNTNDAAFSVSIERSTDSTPTTWTLVASHLTPSDGEWSERDWGYTGGGSTALRWWTYRAWAVRLSDGSISGSKHSSATLNDTIDFCESGGEI